MTSDSVDGDRGYLRHPSDIPIQYEIEDAHAGSDVLSNISHGGLCFRTDDKLPVGSKIKIDLELGGMSATIEGVVAWIVKKDYVFEVGVKFLQNEDVFHFRLIEQVCSIAHYRNEMREAGRELTNEEAAQEWISKFAASYPDLSEHEE